MIHTATRPHPGGSQAGAGANTMAEITHRIIPQSCKGIGNAIEELSLTLENLESRLRPVVQAEPASPQKLDEKSFPTSGTELGDVLQQFNHRIGELIARVNYLNRTVQL